MRVDCLECATLKTDIAWGPYTEPPMGYCWVKNIYIWKAERNCTKFIQMKHLDWLHNAGTSVEVARRHHLKHGDMDGHTCLLSKCALHYPESSAPKEAEA